MTPKCPHSGWYYHDFLPEPCISMVYDPAIMAVFGRLAIASLYVGLVMSTNVVAVIGTMLGQLLLAQSKSRNLDAILVPMKLLLQTSEFHTEGLPKPLSARLALRIIFRGVLRRGSSRLAFRSRISSIIWQQSMISIEWGAFLVLNCSSNLSASSMVIGPPSLSLSTVTHKFS